MAWRYSKHTFYLCETEGTYLADGGVRASVLGSGLQQGKNPFKFTVKADQPF